MSVSKVFEARYPGRCGGCRIPFDAGDPVFYRDDVLYATDGCDPDIGGGPPEEDIAKARKEMCQDCFTVHAGDCL